MGNKLRQELLHKCAPVTEVYGRARHTAIVFGTSHICIEMIMKEYQELVLVLLDKYGKRESWYRIDYKYELFFLITFLFHPSSMKFRVVYILFAFLF